MKDVVFYFSATGKNKLIALAMKDFIDCDIVEISDRNRRNFFRDSFYSIIRRIVNVNPENFDFSPYERIFLVTPVWAGNLPFPTRSFLVKYKEYLKDKKIILLSSSGFGEKNKSIAGKVSDILGKNVDKYLLLKENDVVQGSFRNNLENFLKNIIK